MKGRKDDIDRERASKDLTASYLLDAGAGTGKTTVLVDRIMEIVSEGKACLDRIAAITFTEKAAGELKFRLRLKIDQSLAKAREAGNESAAAVMQKAQADLEKASVGTIHSFCASMLRERPAEAGVDPRFEVADEFEAGLMLDETWDDWLSGQMADPLPVLGEIVSLGLKFDGLKSLAARLAENRDFMENVQPSESTPGPGKTIAALKSILADLDGKAESCRDKSDTLIADIESLRKFVDQFEGGMTRADAIAYTEELDLKPKGAKAKWKPESVKDEVQGLLKDAIGIAGDYKNAVAASLAADVLYWLRGFVVRYGDVKSARGTMDFQDLLLHARDLLQKDKYARDYFIGQYDYLLVDEFQDTDPLQAQIVFFLAESAAKAAKWDECGVKPGKLFLVGDPKQSIYAFRRADRAMYKSVETALLKNGNKAQLANNFRTVAPIVEWVNDKFEQIIGSEETDIQPAYQPIESDRGDPPADVKAGVWKLPVPGIDYEARSKVDEKRRNEARTIAAFLREIVGRWKVFDKDGKKWRPMHYGDVALLFIKRTGIGIFESALVDYDIPYVSPGRGGFFKTVEISALFNCLKAIDRPDDSISIVGALRSPFFGFSDEEIFLARHAGMELDYTASLPDGPDAEKFSKAFALLKDLHDRRNSGSMAALIEEFYSRTLGPVTFMLKPSGGQRLANLFKALEYARRFGKTGARTFGELVANMESAEELARGEEEAAVWEEGDRFVRLMTVHGAKGLEFPMVIVADMTLKRKNDEKTIFDRESGRIGYELKSIRTAGWDEAWENNDMRYGAEMDRLLYVACTRARDYLVLPAPEKGLSDGITSRLLADAAPDRQSEIYSYPSESLVFRDEVSSKPFRVKIDSRSGPEAEEALADFKAWGKKLKENIAALERPGRFATVTGVARKDSGQAEKAEPNEAMKFGSFVHEIMESIDFEGPKNIDRIAEHIGNKMGMKEAQISRAAATAQRAVDSDVWKRAAKAERRVKEYPIVASSKEGVMSGRPDLVFVEDGELVIVDYKTDFVKSHEEAVAKIQKGSYAGQGKMYAEAIAKITKLKVKETVFLFISPDRAIDVRPDE